MSGSSPHLPQSVLPGSIHSSPTQQMQRDATLQRKTRHVTAARRARRPAPSRVASEPNSQEPNMPAALKSNRGNYKQMLRLRQVPPEFGFARSADQPSRQGALPHHFPIGCLGPVPGTPIVPFVANLNRPQSTLPRFITVIIVKYWCRGRSAPYTGKLGDAAPFHGEAAVQILQHFRHRQPKGERRTCRHNLKSSS